MLGTINLEDNALSLAEDKEINLDSTIKVLGGYWGTLKGITTPGIGEKCHTLLF
jgi:hypothetical protein